MTIEELVQRVRSRTYGRIPEDRPPIETVIITSAAVRELGIEIDEATGTLSARAAAPEIKIAEDNWRNSTFVPGRRG